MKKMYHILVITKKEFIPIEHINPNKYQSAKGYYNVVYLEVRPKDAKRGYSQSHIQSGVFIATEPQLYEDITKEIDARNFKKMKTSYDKNEVLFLTDLQTEGQIMSFPSPVYTWADGWVIGLNEVIK